MESWYSEKDREKFDKVMSKKDEDLTEEEKDFQRTMYHLMEVACGVD